MRRARVSNHGKAAGILEEVAGGFRFTYDPSYLASGAAPISLTLPLRPDPFDSPILFPFFFGLLSEGSTRELQLRILGIDAADAFGLLVATCEDTVGSVSVEELR
jgi:serine/threonine-protein kinase HipA